ncbi:MAG TPA: YceI family protein [Bacteroidales bacterium]|nr:YceI family protein [Bacteroidales bacterium]
MKKRNSLTKIALLMILLAGLSLPSQGQKYLTRNGMIRFYSDAPAEKIEASNRLVNITLNGATGEMVLRLQMQSFVFDTAEMQDHFNKEYVESDKYPESDFSGKIINLKEVRLGKEGVYPVTVQGRLTLHNVTRDLTGTGTIEVKKDLLIAEVTFHLNLDDYQIAIPANLVNRISNTVQITMHATLDKVIK